MTIGIYKQGFPWTGKDEWFAPVDDWSTPVHCRLVTEEIDWVLAHLDSTDTCIQAGGNIGLWPARYAATFNHVITFEPSAENFKCLVRNLGKLDNVTMYNAALGDSNTSVTLKHPPNKLNRSGACYVEQDPDGKTRQWKLDYVDLPGRVDLIHLDIEGAELYALRGAEQVIKKHWPTIALENRPLAQMKISPAKAVDYLKSLGYAIVANRQSDLILKNTHKH